MLAGREPPPTAVRWQTAQNVVKMDPVLVVEELRRIHPDLSDAASSSIDIALWDLAAQRAGLPLYRLLGGQRSEITPYASFPFYESLPEYIEAVESAASLGYTHFKFHLWGEIKKDLELVTLVQRHFADMPYRFMVDLEAAYELADRALPENVGVEASIGLPSGSWPGTFITASAGPTPTRMPTRILTRTATNRRILTATRGGLPAAMPIGRRVRQGKAILISGSGMTAPQH